MKKRVLTFLICLVTVMLGIFTGCGGNDSGSGNGALEDGTYSAEFNTDSGMFHVNEMYDGKGTLTVKNGEMTIHVTLVSKRIVNLFSGTSEEAGQNGADIIEPVIDKVVYDDGYEDEVYGFDIPVPALDSEFPIAVLGESGNWFDHMVIVSNPKKID